MDSDKYPSQFVSGYAARDPYAQEKEAKDASRETHRERLMRRRAHFADAMARVDAALAILDALPGAERVINALRDVGIL